MMEVSRTQGSEIAEARRIADRVCLATPAHARWMADPPWAIRDRIWGPRVKLRQTKVPVSMTVPVRRVHLERIREPFERGVIAGPLRRGMAPVCSGYCSSFMVRRSAVDVRVPALLAEPGGKDQSDLIVGIDTGSKAAYCP